MLGVNRLVVAREMHALVQGFDFAHILQHLLIYITRRTLAIEAYLYSNTVFDVITKDDKTS